MMSAWSISSAGFATGEVFFRDHQVDFEDGLAECLALRVGSQGTARPSGEHARQEKIKRAQVWQFVSDYFANAQWLEKLFHARGRQAVAQNRKSLRSASDDPDVRARAFVAAARISDFSQANLAFGCGLFHWPFGVQRLAFHRVSNSFRKYGDAVERVPTGFRFKARIHSDARISTWAFTSVFSIKHGQ